MARWPSPPRRRRASRRGWALALVGVIAAGAYFAWYKMQLPPQSAAEISETALLPLAPALYGAPERELAIPGAGVGVLVEGEGPVPLAVLLVASPDAVAPHAGVQAMLERAGVASLVLPIPADSSGAAALTGWVARTAAARPLPVRLVIPGPLLDRWLALTPPSSLPLLVLGSSPRPRTLREVIGLAADTIDRRLAGWEDVAIAVAPEDTLAARRLARTARRGLVVTLDGEPIDPPSPHPDPSNWRGVIAVLRGYWEGWVEVEVRDSVDGER